MYEFRLFIVLIYFVGGRLSATSRQNAYIPRITKNECNLPTFECSHSNYGDLYIHCYYPNGTSSQFLSNARGARKFVKSDLYKSKNRLVVFIPGLVQRHDNFITAILRLPHLRKKGVTFCAAGVTIAFSLFNYLRSTCMAKCVGRDVAKYLAALHYLGVDTAKMQVIGHSLGGPAVGVIGRHFQKITNGIKLGRVTAIDGGAPCLCIDHPVTKTDAVAVDVYHCSVHQDFVESGGGDFFPNCSFDQPGCGPISVCSHLQCLIFYADTVKEEGDCLAAECDSCRNLTSNTCNRVGVQVGYHWDGTPGKYYYKTHYIIRGKCSYH